MRVGIFRAYLVYICTTLYPWNRDDRVCISPKVQISLFSKIIPGNVGVKYYLKHIEIATKNMKLIWLSQNSKKDQRKGTYLFSDCY